MRVAIDAHALGTRAGGNESYIRALLFALARQDGDIVPVALTPPGWGGELPPGVLAEPLHTRRSALRVAFDLPYVLRREPYDLFHGQYILPPFCPCPAVVSIHDFVWKKYPHTLPPFTRYRLQALIPRTLTRARRVFVLSETMRTELAEYYGFPEQRIDVVPPAVHPRFTETIPAETVEQVRAKYGLPSDYLLYTGALQPRKNLGRLLEAFAAVKGEGLPHRLVIVGKEAWMARSIGAAVARLSLKDELVFTGYVEDADLPALYKGAAAFVYVSIYEGFGIPIVEAMACSTPVLTSNTGALAEVAGDAALTCDPFDPSAIADGLRRILTDDDTQHRLRHSGPRRAGEFSHEAMRVAALSGYRQAR
jgi:glycosyltransferase involved in cell wall biosynthesis